MTDADSIRPACPAPLPPSARLRAGVECAPWVLEAVLDLEAHLALALAALDSHEPA